MICLVPRDNYTPSEPPPSPPSPRLPQRERNMGLGQFDAKYCDQCCNDKCVLNNFPMVKDFLCDDIDYECLRQCAYD